MTEVILYFLSNVYQGCQDLNDRAFNRGSGGKLWSELTEQEQREVFVKQLFNIARDRMMKELDSND